MRKVISLAVILTFFSLTAASLAEAPNFDDWAKSLYEERIKTDEAINAANSFYNGQIFIYDKYIVVYIPELQKWTFVRLSDLKDVAVAEESSSTPNQ